MRGVPTLAFGSGVRFYSSATSATTFSIQQNRSGSTTLSLAITISGGTAGQAGSLFQHVNDATAYIEVDAEI